MKRIRIWIVSCLLLAGLAGCDTATKIEGEYSYRLSGKVEVEDQTVALNDEQGTLDVLKKRDDLVLLMFSRFRGGVYTARAEVADTALTLYPFQKQVTLTFTVPDTITVGGIETVREKSVTETFDVEVTGDGTLYKETIVFDLYYHGESQSSDAVLTGEEIVMVAKKN